MLSLESRLLLIFTQWSNCPRPLSIFCKHNTQGLALFKWQKRVALENINCNNCQLVSVHSACTRLDFFWNETEIFRTDIYKTFLSDLIKFQQILLGIENPVWTDFCNFWDKKIRAWKFTIKIEKSMCKIHLDKLKNNWNMISST